VLGLINIACDISVRPATSLKSIEIRCDVSECRGICPKNYNRYIFDRGCLIESPSELSEKRDQETEKPIHTTKDVLKEKLKELAEQGLPNSQAKILTALDQPKTGKSYELLREVAKEENIELPEVKSGPREPTSDLKDRITAGLKALQELGELPSQKKILRSMGLSGGTYYYDVLREVAEELNIELPPDATGRKTHQKVRETVRELRKKSFRQLSAAEKNERILEIVGNEKLTATEIAAKLNVYGGGLSTIFHRMVQAKTLDREPYKIRKNGKPEGYIYFRPGYDGEVVTPEAKPEAAQEPTKEKIDITSPKNDDEEIEFRPLSDEEKMVLDALPERKWFKVKAICRRIGPELSRGTIKATLKSLVDKGYIQKDLRNRSEKNPVYSYSKISETDLMREFYLGSASIEKIAQKHDIPVLRVTQVITSEAGKLYASVNLDEPHLQQQRKDDLQIERELTADSEVADSEA